MKKRYGVALIIVLVGVYVCTQVSVKDTTVGESSPPELATRTTPTRTTWQEVYGEQVKTFTFETTPTPVPALLEHPGTTTTNTVAVPEDMWVIGAETDVRGGPSELLHHTNYIHHGARPSFCGGGYPFFASGKERTSGFFPLGYGYAINKGDEIEGLAMYHNESDVGYGGVETVITFWYIPRSVADLKEVYPLLVDVFTPCVLGDFTVPGGVVHYREESDEPFIVREPGEVVLVGSHLHDHASFITLSINGNDVLTVTPEKNLDGAILSIPLVYPSNLLLKAGDALRVKMEADNPHTDHDHDMMSQMFLYVHPTESNF